MSDLIKEFSEGLSEQLFQKRFLENRQVYLWGPVTDSSSRDIINRIIWLASENDKDPIKFYINSPGGVISSGMAVVDVMNMVKAPIHTICMGLAASMGAVLLASGDKGNRYVWPSGRVMIHQPLISGQIIAPAIDIKIHADEIKKTRKMLNQLLADACGKKIDQLEKDTDRDFYMNAQEAVDYGIADKVADKVY